MIVCCPFPFDDTLLDGTSMPETNATYRSYSAIFGINSDREIKVLIPTPIIQDSCQTGV